MGFALLAVGLGFLTLPFLAETAFAHAGHMPAWSDSTTDREGPPFGPTRGDKTCCGLCMGQPTGKAMPTAAPDVSRRQDPRWTGRLAARVPGPDGTHRGGPPVRAPPVTV